MKSTGLILLGATLLAMGAAPYHVIARYAMPDGGGWDYITLDAVARRLYVSHATVVDVIDADSGKPIGQIPDTPGVHGIALAPAFHHGFTTNGRENKVSMFDPATLKLIKKIDVGQGPDSIYYDAGSNRVFTGNHGSHNISVLDAKTGDVAGTIHVNGDGEQMVKSRDGLLYLNLEDTAEVVAIDPHTLVVIKRFPIGVAQTPTGLGYDAKNHRLFVMCRREPKMVVMDAASGKVITSFSIGSNVDWGHFDASTGLIFASCGDGTLHVFHQKSADEYEPAGIVKTQPSAKTMAFDPKTKKIFLPAAEFETSAAEPGKAPSRQVKPGSFVVLVVGPE